MNNSRIRISIVVIILLIPLSLSSFIDKLQSTGQETQIEKCILTTVKNVFIDTTNLHLVINRQENHQDIVRILYKHFSLSIESKIIPNNSTKFLIIENNQKTLRKRFEEISLSKWSEYLIITKAFSLIDIQKFANFLYKMEFYFTAFLSVSHQTVTIIQFQLRANNYNEIVHSIECNDEFLISQETKSLIRRFDKFVCPPSGCTLTYWNIVSEAPNNLTYRIYENGTTSAYSIGADMLEEFAKMYDIEITRDLNHSIVDMSWNEGVKAVLNETIDVLYGFSMPTSKDVELLTASTWIRFYFLGLLYVPDYNHRSTGLGSFFIPLEFEVWICFTLVIIFHGFFIIGVRYVYRKKLIREYLKAGDLLRIFLKQDVSHIKNGGLRFAMGLMLIFGLLITTAYESMITSSFISKSPPILLNTLRDVCESNRRFGGAKFIHQFIDKTSYFCSRNFYDSYEEVNVTTIIDLMHFERAIMMHNVDINNYAVFVYRDRFNHRTSQQPFAYYPSLYYTKPKHPFQSLLIKFVLNFHSAGLEMRLEDKYKLGHKLCESCEDEISYPLTISQLKFSWFSLFIGWIMSCAILSIEFFHSKFNFYYSNSRI